MSQALSEFDLIARYFDVPALKGSEDNPFISLSIGDDCALLQPTPHHQLAVSVDTLVSGIHFPVNVPPKLLAWRSLAVSVSDLAAMGATPKGFTLALTLPEANSDWLASFASGLAEAAQHYGVVLFGGDTTKGPLAISVQVFGEVPSGLALRRDGANIGDAVFVSGELGGAHVALDYLADEANQDPLVDQLLQAYYKPDAAIALGQALRGVASAAVDISDGLLADLGHIASRSGLSITVHSHLIPVHPAVTALCNKDRALEAATKGGDDYQLAFCVPESKIPDLLALPFNLTRIGTCKSGAGVLLDDQHILSGGFQHFEV